MKDNLENNFILRMDTWKGKPLDKCNREELKQMTSRLFNKVGELLETVDSIMAEREKKGLTTVDLLMWAQVESLFMFALSAVAGREDDADYTRKRILKKYNFLKEQYPKGIFWVDNTSEEAKG